MIKNPLDDGRLLNAGDDAKSTAAARAEVDLNGKHALEALSLGHGPAGILIGGCRGCSGMIGRWPGNHLGPQGAVGREHAVISGQMGFWLGHQGDQPGDKVHRFEDDVRGAIGIGSLKRIADVSAVGQRQPLDGDGGTTDIACQVL